MEIWDFPCSSRIIEKINARDAVTIQRNESLAKTEEGEMGHSIQCVSYVITLYFTNAYSVFSTLIPLPAQSWMKDWAEKETERKENPVPLYTLARSL